MPDGIGPSHGVVPAPAVWFDNEPWVEADIPPRPWIAPGYLLRGAVTLITGAPGGSKSYLVVAWSTALAFGLELGRFKPNGKVRVMSYNVEDDLDERRRRYSAGLRRCGHTSGDLVRQVIQVGAVGVGTLFDYDAIGNRLRPTPAFEALEKRICQDRPDVLILDPLAELHTADENSNTHLRAVTALFRTLAARHDMAVVILHHSRKGGGGAAGDPESARGASALMGAVRIALTVTPMTAEDATAFGLNADAARHFFRVESAKANYAPLDAADWFERCPVTLDNGDGAAMIVPWSPPNSRASADQQAAIEVGIALGSTIGPWSPKLSSDARSVKLLMEQHGIVAAVAQKHILTELLQTGGIQVAEFRRDNGAVAQGLRASDGRPLGVKWLLENRGNETP